MGVVAKLAASDLTPIQFLFWSNLLSTLVIGILIKLQRVEQVFKEIKHNLFKTMIPAFLGCFFYYLVLYYAYAKTNGISVLVVQYTWPALIVIFSPFILKEKLSITSIIAVILGFLAVVIVITKGSLYAFNISNAMVLLVVLLGAMSFALFSVLAKKIQAQVLIAALLFFSWASVFSLLYIILFGKFGLPHSVSSIISLLLNGAIINGVSYFWWLRALSLEKASNLAPLVFFTPILASIWIVLFFGDHFYISYIFGIALCILAGILVSKPTKFSSKK